MGKPVCSGHYPTTNKRMGSCLDDKETAHDRLSIAAGVMVKLKQQETEPHPENLRETVGRRYSGGGPQSQIMMRRRGGHASNKHVLWKRGLFKLEEKGRRR